MNVRLGFVCEWTLGIGGIESILVDPDLEEDRKCAKMNEEMELKWMHLIYLFIPFNNEYND